MNIKNIKLLNKKGSTLLFAILISTIVLVIGLALTEIIIAEIKMGKDIERAQIAYSNMESGLELGILEAQKSIEERTVFQTSDTYFLLDRFFKIANTYEEVWLKGRGLIGGVRRDYERKLADFWKVHQQSGLDLGRDSGIAIDSNGYPHISYIRYANGGATMELYYTRWNGTSWQNPVKVDPIAPDTTAVGQYSDIVLINDLPHIVYRDWTNRKLKHSYKTTESGGWTINNPFPADGNCSPPSIVKDNNNIIHIGYTTLSDQQVYYVTYNPTTGVYTRENSLQGMSPLPWPQMSDMVIDLDNKPHFTFFDRSTSPGKYYYMKKNGSAWEKSEIDTAPFTGQEYTNLTLDLSKNPPVPHVAYTFYDGSNYVIKYAKYNGITWDTETVATDYYQDWSNNALIWYKNRAWIIYTERNNSSLVFLRKIGNNWQRLGLDRGPGDYITGWSPTITTDFKGNIYISYFGNSDTSLRYAKLESWWLN